MLGYDRPSPKFIAFLAKHYGLRDYVPQTNNFVVFKQYFAGGSGAGTAGSASARGTQRRCHNVRRRACSAVPHFQAHCLWHAPTVS